MEENTLDDFAVSANTENQLIRYHSNHHFSIVQMKPAHLFMFLYQQRRPTVIKIYCYQDQCIHFTAMFEMMSFRTHACPKSLCFRLNTSSSTASMLVAVRAVLGLPLPDFLVIDPVCFKRLTKSFNVFSSILFIY